MPNSNSSVLLQLVYKIAPASSSHSEWRRHGDRGRLVALCLLISLSSIMPVGYHMVVLNVPSEVVQSSMNRSLHNTFGINLNKGGMSILWSATVSCQALGALIGCFLVVPIQRKYGVKTGMMSCSSTVLVAGSFLSSLAALIPFAPLLPLGRILTGIHTGIACALVPLYVQQIAPKDIKGSLSCFLHVAVCFGSAAAAILSLPFMLGGPSTWAALLVLPALLGAAQLIMAFFVPDTPNDLLQKGSYSQAIASIKFYYDIEEEDEDEAIRKYWDMVPEVPEQISWCTAFWNPSIRKGILLGAAVSASQVFSGSMATISYSSSMFSAVSFIDVLVPFLPALGSLISIILTVPALQLVESCGRRPLLLKTLLLCVAADILLMIFSQLSQNSPANSSFSWWFAASFLLYGVGYNLGAGPVAYFLPAELVPPEAAGISLGVAVAVNWLCSLLTTLFYYPLIVAVGGLSYLLFIIPTSLLLLVLYQWLPETRDVSPTDVLSSRLLHDLGTPYGTFDDK